MNIGDLIRPGTEVKFKEGNVKGIIKAIWLCEGFVNYQVIYMYNGEVKEPYVLREMFEILEKQEPVGFRLNP